MEDALKYLKYDWKEKKWCEIESTALHIIEESAPLLPSSLQVAYLTDLSYLKALLLCIGDPQPLGHYLNELYLPLKAHTRCIKHS